MTFLKFISLVIVPPSQGSFILFPHLPQIDFAENSELSVEVNILCPSSSTHA